MNNSDNSAQACNEPNSRWTLAARRATSAWGKRRLRPLLVAFLFVFASATLTSLPALAQAPVVEQQPSSLTVTQGQSATFTVVATGESPLAYQWRFQAVAIAGATESSYTVSNAQSAQIGNYFVTVTNSSGTVTSALAVLNVVEVAPSITQQPVNWTVNAGQYAGFAVSATGTAPLSYQWRRGGANISGATGPAYGIPGAQANQAGTYSVVVTNSYGSVTSSPATLTVKPALRGGRVRAWGASEYNYGQTIVPVAAQNGVTAIAAGITHTLALRSDGTVVGWGNNDYGQTTVPEGLSGVTAIATGPAHTLALKSDGTMVGWGNNDYGQITVPAGLGGLMAVASGYMFTVVLKSDGTVVGWGNNDYGQTTIPVGLSGVKAITVRGSHVLALKNDGTVVAWGSNGQGESSVPAGLSGVAATAAGENTSMTLKDDGTVVMWGYNFYGQTNVPVGLTGVVAIAAGGLHNLAAKSDGSVVAWGLSWYGAMSVPSDLCGVTAVAVGVYHSVALEVCLPAITVQPQDQAAGAGSNITFSVSVTGASPFHYQWRKQGLDIAGANNANYSIGNVQAVDAGSYQVVVTNAYGAVTSTVAILNVAMIAPQITQPPSSLTVTQGQSAAFTVSATGDSPLSYQWRFMAAAIAGATQPSYSVVNAQGSNAGPYTVVVANGCGSATSAVATLTVVGIPPYITQQPISLVVAQDHDASFTVSATGDLPLYYQWRFNGTDLTGATETTYTVANAQAGEVGPYTVVVTNALGAVTSAVATLKVRVPPSVTQQPASVTVTQGQSAVFTVSAAGDLPLSYQWRLQAVAIGGATQSSYTVSNVQGSNAGPYTVVVANDCGSVTSSVATLTVRVPPSISQQPGSLTVTQGQGAVFTVGATGDAPLSYQWRLQAVDIAGATGSGYTVLNAHASNAGLYTVVVANGCGSVTSLVATLTLLVPPSITQQPASVTVTQGQSAAFTVGAAGDLPLSYQWRFQGVDIGGATESSFTMSNPQASNAGPYSVVVVNVSGSVTSSNAVLTVLSPPTISRQPMSRTVVPRSAVRLTVSAVGDLPLTYQWLRDGIPLIGKTDDVLSLPNAQPPDMGYYQVVVSNPCGSVTSSEAGLLVCSGTVTAWGDNSYRQTNAPAGLSNLVAIAAGGMHSIALTENGKVVAWGDNSSQQTNVPAGLSNVVAIACGLNHTLALRNDGTVVAWGDGQSDPPGLTNVIAVAAGSMLNMALKEDGTVVASGSNLYGLLDGASGLTDITAITCGHIDSLAARRDGTVIAWGGDAGAWTEVVAGLSSVVAVASGWWYGLALKQDGTVVPLGGWGCGANNVPADLTNAVQIAAGASHCLALRVDGTAVGWGVNYLGEVIIPAGLSNVTQVAAGGNPSFATYYSMALVAGPVAPRITTQPGDQWVDSGGIARLTMRAISSQPIQYQWRLNSATIPGGTNAALEVQSTGAADLGAYQVVASNSLGSVTSAVATLSLRGSPPVVTGQPGSWTNNAGTVVTFSATGWGAPPLSYQWCKQGINLSDSDSVSGAQTLTMTLSNVLGGDAGGYSVIISNGFGSVTSLVATLSVVDPLITSEPVSQTTNLGQAVTFSVAATGTEPFHYQWRKQGVDIAGANSSGYTVANVQAVDARNYQVVITNVYGAVTSTVAELKILGVPDIYVDGQLIPGGAVVRPDSAQVSMETSLPSGTLFYTLDGSEPSFASSMYFEPFTLTSSATVRAIAYSEDFSQALLSASVKVIILPTYSLTVGTPGGGSVSLDPPTGPYMSNTTVNVTAKADAGWSFLYWTGDASGTNNPASVTMNGPRSVQAVFGTAVNKTVVGQGTVTLDPAQGPYPYNSTVRLSAVPNSGYYFVRWANASTSTVSPLSVTVTRTNATYTALFTALATNQFALTLLANGPGSVTAVPAKNMFTNGETVTLTASPNALQGFDYWSGNASGAQNPLTLVMNQSRVVTGNFSAAAAPTITAQPQGQAVAQGATFALSVAARGSAPLDYQWYLDSRAVGGGTNASLAFTNAQGAQIGNYFVTVSNAYGAVTSVVALLNVLGVAPYITQPPLSLTMSAGQNASFSVGAKGTVPLSYQWRKDGTNLSGATGPAYSIVGAQADQMGTYAVVVTNSHGSVTSSPVTLTVKPALPSGTVRAWGARNNGVIIADYGQAIVPIAAQNGVTAIAAGDSHTLALKGDGTMVAWGRNDYGEGTVPEGLSGVVAIGAGDSHNLAVRSDGTVVAWGRNDWGQATVPEGLGGVVAVAGGTTCSVALKSDGTVAAWGNNDNGQTTIPAGLSGVRAIAAAGSHVLALKDDGTVVAWGSSYYGESTVPVGLSGVVAIAAGSVQGMALKGDGTVVMWGYNWYGQTDVPAGLSEVKAIAAGGLHNLAAKSDGTVVPWGYFYYGGTTLPSDLRRVTAVAVGFYHSVALVMPQYPTIVTQPLDQTAGAGSNVMFSASVMGDSPFYYQWRKQGVDIAGANTSDYSIANVQAVDAGSYQVVVTNMFGAVTSAVAVLNVLSMPPTITAQPLGTNVIAGGNVMFAAAATGTTPFYYQWRKDGTNLVDGGRLSGALTSTLTLSDVFIADAGDYSVIISNAAGSLTSSAATLTVRTVVAWGNNYSSQTNVPVGLTGVKAVAAGESYSVALNSNGTVVVWGRNDDGETNVPAGLTGVTAVAAGGYHVLALKNNGTVVGWGADYYGQRSVPTNWTGMKAIAAGRIHSLGLKTNGTVVGAGWDVGTPGALIDVKAIAAGDNYNLALRSNGTVVAWGSGLPSVPAGLSGVAAIAAGAYRALALKTDGTVVVWGSGGGAPAGLTGVTAIAAGESPNMALKEDGTVIAWGIDVPAGLRRVAGIAAGGYHCMALIGPDPITPIAPVITARPWAQLKELGQTATFSVTAAGAAPLGYQWWKDGAALPGATGSSLTIINSQIADAGDYLAVVSNAYGSVTSTVATLTVTLLDLGFNPGANPLWPDSIAVQADGRILVVGEFSNLGGQPRNCIGRLNANGTLDSSFNPGADTAVFSLAVQSDGMILVGGAFNNLGGLPRSHIGRLNADATVDFGFDPGAYPVSNVSVYCLALQADGMILVGGRFATLAGQTRNCIGRLTADGTLDSSFNPGANSTLFALAVQADGKILVGGYFTTLGGQTRNYIGRLTADGTLDSSFNPGANNYVSSLAVQADGKILVGGYFTTLGGQTRNKIARLNADGTLDSSFNPGASPEANMGVGSMAVQADGKILVGGPFTKLGGQTRNCIGRLNADGTLDGSFNPGTDALSGVGVSAIAVQPDGKILVGGYFTVLGGQPCSKVGRLNNTGPATQALTSDGSTVIWLRGGSSPEVWRTTFEYTTDGITWTNLGAGLRIPGGWQLNGLSLGSNGVIRARGYVASGSSWFVETTNSAAGIPAIAQQPLSLAAAQGQSAAFRVVAVGKPSLSYQWRFNGADIAGATESIFTVANAQATNAGQYTVVVTNTAGSVVSSVATLSVGAPPALTQQPISLSLTQGLDATFTVSASGDSPLRYQWRFNGTNLSGATSASFTIISAQEANQGGYNVEVTNIFGAATSAVATLTVLYRSA
jgi:uncharacterized delta-60 repeat protein